MTKQTFLLILTTALILIGCSEIKSISSDDDSQITTTTTEPVTIIAPNIKEKELCDCEACKSRIIVENDSRLWVAKNFYRYDETNFLPSVGWNLEYDWKTKFFLPIDEWDCSLAEEYLQLVQKAADFLYEDCTTPLDFVIPRAELYVRDSLEEQILTITFLLTPVDIDTGSSSWIGVKFIKENDVWVINDVYPSI